jgi:hypothetical protein
MLDIPLRNTGRERRPGNDSCWDHGNDAVAALVLIAALSIVTSIHDVPSRR